MTLKTITVETKSRSEMIDITSDIKEAIVTSGVKSGVCVIFTPHTTASVLISENVDPRLRRDILGSLSRIAPDNIRYAHVGDNASAHIKSARNGVSLSIPVVDAQPILGQWQGVFFAEFDGPREQRQIHIKTIAG